MTPPQLGTDGLKHTGSAVHLMPSLLEGTAGITLPRPLVFFAFFHAGKQEVVTDKPVSGAIPWPASACIHGCAFFNIYIYIYIHTRELFLGQLLRYRHPTVMQASYRHTDILRVYRHPTVIQTSYSYTDILQLYSYPIECASSGEVQKSK